MSTEGIDFQYGDHSQYKNYVDIVKLAVSDDFIFHNFKSNSNYTGILEHVSYELGLRYLDEIKRYGTVIELPQTLWSSMLENDSIGNPNTFFYDIPGLSTKHVSPTTLRYIKFGLDLVGLIKLWSLNDEAINICEIGSGYGGFCKIFMDLAKHFNIKINKYQLYDLEDPAKLAKKYLDEIGVSSEVFETGTLETLKVPENGPTICLAFYSYSEISLEFRKLYSNLIDKSNHGFMCWNSNVSDNDIRSELNKNITISPEVPLTGQYNRVVTW